MLKNLKLSTQMMLVSTICGLSLILMTLYALNEIGRVQSLEIQYEHQRQLLYQSERVQKTLIEISEKETHFVETGEAFFAEKFTALHHRLVQDLLALSSRDQTREFEPLKTGGHELSLQFDKVRDLRSQLGGDGTHGRIFDVKMSGNRFENKLDFILLEAQSKSGLSGRDIQAHVMMMRLSEHNLLNEVASDTLYTLLKTNIFDVGAHIEASRLSAADRATLLEALGGYEQAVSTYVALKKQVAETHLGFVAIKNDMIRQMQQLTFSYDKNLLPMMQASRQARQEMQYNLIMALGMALLAAVLAGAVVTNSVTNQFKFTASYLKKLGKGEYDFKIAPQSDLEEMDDINKKLRKVQGRMEQMDHADLEEPELQETIRSSDNVVDFRQKMFELNRTAYARTSQRPKK